MRVGTLLVLASAASYGSQPVLARLAYAAGASVPTVLLLRFAMAAALLWALLLAGGRAGQVAAVARRPGRLLALLGLGLVYAANAFTYFSALTAIRAGVAVLVLYL